MFGHTAISSSHKREGFTLIEVVVASAVMMVMFVAILGTISTARRISSITENRLACMHMARETLETMTRRGYDSSDFDVGKKYFPNNRGYCNITQVSGQRTKDVEVVINWIEPSGVPQSISLKSSYSRSLHR